jgi:hypothetical protein
LLTWTIPQFAIKPHGHTILGCRGVLTVSLPERAKQVRMLPRMRIAL